MRFFYENVSRKRTCWLLVHGALLVLIGFLLCKASYDDVKTVPLAYWRYHDLEGDVARLLMALIGLIIVIVASMRLFRPFTLVEIFKNFETFFVTELILILFSGMILDGGKTAAFVSSISLISNLIYLAAPPTKIPPRYEWLLKPLFKKK